MAYDIHDYLDDIDYDYDSNEGCWTCGKPIRLDTPDIDYCSQACKDHANQAADEAADNRYL